MVTWQNLITLALALRAGAYGLIIGPFGVSLPPLPPAPVIGLSFQPSPEATSMSVDLDLEQQAGGAVQLELQVYGQYASSVKQVAWTADVRQFTGTPCPATHPPFLTLHKADHYFLHGSVVPPRDLALPFLTVDLSWTADSPVAIAGPYLAAAIPPVTVGSDAGTLTRSLYVPGLDLVGYSLQAGTAPEVTTSNS